MTGVIRHHKTGYAQLTAFKVIKQGDFIKTAYDLPRDCYVGQSGSGKSTAMCSHAEQYYGKAKIICLTDLKNNIEAGSVAFEPKDKHHLWELKFYHNKTPKAYPIKVHAPFSYNVKKIMSLDKKVPPIEFFTIPIKSLSRENLSVIFSLYKKSSIIENSIIIKNKMKKSDGLPQFYSQFEVMASNIIQTSKGAKLIGSLSDDTNLSVDSKSVKDFKTYVKILHDYDRFLSSEDNPHNIDIVKILNDVNTIDIFTGKFCADEKSIDIMYDCIMSMIVWALENNKVKQDIIIKMDEITSIFTNDFEGHKLFIGQNMAKRLTSMRKIGRYGCGFILGANSLSNCSRIIKDTGFNVFLGPGTPQSDINTFLRRENSVTYNTPSKLEIGQFHYVKEKQTKAFKIFMPRHAMSERGWSFMESFVYQFPDECITFKKQYNELKEIFKAEDDRNIEFVDNYNSKQIEKHKRNVEEKQKSKEDKADVVKKSQKDVNFDELVIKMYVEDRFGCDKINNELKKLNLGWKGGFYKVKTILKDAGVYNKVKTIEYEIDTIVSDNDDGNFVNKMMTSENINGKGHNSY